MKIPSNGFLANSGEGEKKVINSELWHACAGPLVCLPPVGSLVVYFPQGHSEQADVETDEVYAQMTLQPVTKDFSMQPPAQELVARDLHDQTWTFRHIYRGQPKRHLLTTGWSVFVSSKRLVAGDAVLFIRDEKSQLLLGIRRANRQQPALSSSVISSDSMHIGILAAAAHAAANNSPFTIFYNPRLDGMNRQRGNVLAESQYGTLNLLSLHSTFARLRFSDPGSPNIQVSQVQKRGSVGRTIDVTRYKGYDELRHDLARMFGIEGLLEDPQRTEWKLVYVDHENDILLVGDDPWEEFVSCVQSIKILSSAEVQQMSLDGDLGQLPVPNQACSGTDSGNAWRGQYDDNSATSFNR
ncbi:UNVERIFIED_CONTAM: Auxin response factor 19 [Sesamum radiatum]|uniref:Auxin response factor 19 n=1 Tax=Sesamum radiatum TaxID=300843 RepID=A0AAW2R3A2_SESRA